MKNMGCYTRRLVFFSTVFISFNIVISSSCQVSSLGYCSHLGFPATIQAFDDFDIHLFLIKLFSQSNQMIDNMSEPFLAICNGFPWLHSEQLILLDECMLSRSLDIICPFICDF